MFGNVLYSARRFTRRWSDAGQKPASDRHIGSPRVSRRNRIAAMAAAVSLLGGLAVTSVGSLGVASANTVGQGFTVTPADLDFILQQIKIAEAHVANTTEATGPCGALVGPGPDQIASPLLSFGLRTVDGSCNNLQARPRDLRRSRPDIPASDRTDRSGPQRRTHRCLGHQPSRVTPKLRATCSTPSHARSAT